MRFRPKGYFWHFCSCLIVVSLAGLLGGQPTWAGTTGGLAGSVVTAANVAVAAAKVTAASPSQTTSTVTDSSGHFSFVSLAPDTYAVTASKDGYDPLTSHVTVTADNVQTLTLVVQPSVRKIGTVTVRGTATLVKPGTTADVYSVGAHMQAAAAALGGGGGLNNAYSGVAAVPGAFVPIGQNGAYQSVFVRGGNYTQVGYEFDGVPIQRAFDQYPGGNLSSLGQQELQVYTGAAPVNSDSTALAGFINQVIRVGTYPGSIALRYGAGSPAMYNTGTLEASGATANRNFSYYFGLSGYAQQVKLEKDHEFDSLYGGVIQVFKGNCTLVNTTAGCYKNNSGLNGVKLGPTGYEPGPIFWGTRYQLWDRDNVFNFHFGLPHHRDGGRDDIQLLYDAQALQTLFASTLSDFDTVAPDVLNGTYTSPSGTVFPHCAGAGSMNCGFYGSQAPQYYDHFVYTGPLGTALQASNLTQTDTYRFPGSPVLRLGNSLVADQSNKDSYQQNAAITKLQYQHNFSTDAFLRIYGYTQYSDWLQYGPGGITPDFYGSISGDYKLAAHTRGIVANFTDQINSKHLLNLNASYTTASTFRNNNSGIRLSGSPVSAASSTVAFLVDSTNPTNGKCYRMVGIVPTLTDCALATTARYIIPGMPGGFNLPTDAPLPLIKAHGGDPTIATAGTFTCGGGPCEYFTIANGFSATYNTVTPRFTAFSVQDSWKPNDRITATFGLRYDDFRYELVDTTDGPARQFWVNYYNLWNCFNAHNSTVGSATLVAGVPTCAAGTTHLAFSSQSLATTDYPVWQPRFGMTYTLNPNDVLRFSYGRYAQPASSAFQQYNTIQPNIVAGTNLLFYTNGYTNPSHVVYPEESYNTDLTWEHQTGDLAWALTPYIRTTKNEITTVLLDPKTNFVSGINVGQKNVKGFEFAVHKGDINRDGLFAQLSYTYTFARIKFGLLPNGQTVPNGLNLSVSRYNDFTSFCATNFTDPRCGSLSVAPATASQCFNPATGLGIACAAGTVANPYWNAPVQQLFDPKGDYVVYNTFTGQTAFSGSADSYLVPHVLALVVNYKRGPLNITPSLQLQGGGGYGRPLEQPGVDPTTCGTPLAGSVSPTDPRYSFGAPGGSPYDARNCAGALPIPDQYIGAFDRFGQFTQPTKIALNAGISYDLTKNLKVSLLGTNLYTGCYGGSNVPWKITYGKAGCVYGTNNSVSNFYNPGDVIDQNIKYPYGPVFGSVFQTVPGAQANPAQFYFFVDLKT